MELKREMSEESPDLRKKVDEAKKREPTLTEAYIEGFNDGMKVIEQQLMWEYTWEGPVKPRK
jgi:hypothetical protein